MSDMHREQLDTQFLAVMKLMILLLKPFAAILISGFSCLHRMNSLSFKMLKIGLGASLLKTIHEWWRGKYGDAKFFYQHGSAVGSGGWLDPAPSAWFRL